jgi:hypothetical protein
MYKTDKNMQDAGIVVSSVLAEGCGSFFVCVPHGGRGVHSARHSMIESHGFACKAPAISEKKKLKVIKKR